MGTMIKFSPTKHLFINTLTKDISIHDCVLELLDNSADSYVRSGASDRREIRLDFNKSKFSIFDDCGGISLDELQNRVFVFGFQQKKDRFAGIGMYGIGLKRSILELSRKITFETDDGRTHCKLDLDVDDWEKSDKWEAPLSIERQVTSAKGTPVHTH